MLRAGALMFLRLSPIKQRQPPKPICRRLPLWPCDDFVATRYRFPASERLPPCLELTSKSFILVPESVSNIHSIWRKPGELRPRMLRRLEDRIRYLCRKALTARDDELDALFSELRSALHEHSNRLRQLAGLKLIIAKETLFPERRVRPVYRNDGREGGPREPDDP